MGHYNEQDIYTQEQRFRGVDYSFPSEITTLECYLEELNERLESLNSIRPNDPLHQFFNRCFYEDYKTHYYENPNTVQGLRAAIREVKGRLRTAVENQLRNLELWDIVNRTGAMPDGQMVIIGTFIQEPLTKAG